MIYNIILKFHETKPTLLTPQRQMPKTQNHLFFSSEAQKLTENFKNPSIFAMCAYVYAYMWLHKCESALCDISCVGLCDCVCTPAYGWCDIGVHVCGVPHLCMSMSICVFEDVNCHDVCAIAYRP